MSVPEILCQISTFLAAGHETTSSALTWCLYALSQSPLSQKRLRDAIHSICPSSPTIDEDIARLPYLDWVIRESLRVHAPVTSTMRVVGRDDEIPVRRPFQDKNGKTRRCIKVKKHDIITIPIQAINKSKDVWGEDAHVFRYVGASRWKSFVLTSWQT
jgi:cytochrome P450